MSAKLYCVGEGQQTYHLEYFFTVYLRKRQT